MGHKENRSSICGVVGKEFRKKKSFGLPYYTFSSVPRRKRSNWWSCGSLESLLGGPAPSAGLAGGSFLISTSVLFIPSSLVVEASLGLLSWSSRWRILCLSVRLLWEAGHWGAGAGLGGWGEEVQWMLLLLLLESAPVPLLSRSWLSLGLPSCEAEERGTLTESSPPSSPPSEGFVDRGRIEEPVGVLACLWRTGEDREKDPVDPPLALLLPSPLDCCLLRLPPLLRAPAGEWRPGVEGEKGFPGTRGLPPNPGLARGILGDIKEVGVAVSGLLKGEGLLTCWGQFVRLGVR